MSEVKQTTYTCDLCGAKMKSFNPPKFPTAVGWIRIVRKRKRKDICFGCVNVIHSEKAWLTSLASKCSEPAKKSN